MARILIVEDEPLIAELLAMYVEELGHQVVGPAATVEAALAILEKTPPAFAILDCGLGRQESTPVAEALAKQNLPFAFATGRGVEALPAQFRNSPIIPKPYVYEDVERVLSGLQS